MIARHPIGGLSAHLRICPVGGAKDVRELLFGAKDVVIAFRHDIFQTANGIDNQMAARPEHVEGPDPVPAGCTSLGTSRSSAFFA